jgi:hypothetical protein
MSAGIQFDDYHPAVLSLSVNTFLGQFKNNCSYISTYLVAARFGHRKAWVNIFKKKLPMSYYYVQYIMRCHT